MTRTTHHSWPVILALALSLGATPVACFLQESATPTTAPTATPEPTSTPKPTPTPTSTPLPTDTPRPTLTPRSSIRPGEARTVEAGGFSFQTIAGFRTTIQETSATIASRDDEIVIALGAGTGSPDSPDDRLSVEEILDGFLGAISQDIEDFEAGEPFPISIDGVDGLAVDITGVLFGDDIAGRVAAVALDGGRFFFAFGFAVVGPGENRWETEGSEAFDMVVGSVAFFEPVATASTCPIASDASYGYTIENPIRVGGGAFDGPPRERAYLDTLRGPEGQPITYERRGSTAGEGTILDIYAVWYEGLAEPIVLYIDEYSYETPQAPVGFTCVGPFPLQAP